MQKIIGQTLLYLLNNYHQCFPPEPNCIKNDYQPANRISEYFTSHLEILGVVFRTFVMSLIIHNKHL